MTDFDRWFANQKPEEPELPDGLYRAKLDGSLRFCCRSCDEYADWEGEPSEFSLDRAYCGRSPRCVR